MGARKNVLKSMEIDSKKTVFLVSLKAGGSGQSLITCAYSLYYLTRVFGGLNLTMCNNVILVDPWWNPAEEVRVYPLLYILCGVHLIDYAYPKEQAFDRVHRIGQKKPVYAYRLVAEDTVEERVLKVSFVGFVFHRILNTLRPSQLQEVKRSLATAVLDNGPDLTAVEKLECCFGDVKRATAFPGALRYRQ